MFTNAHSNFSKTEKILNDNEKNDQFVNNDNISNDDKNVIY